MEFTIFGVIWLFFLFISLLRPISWIVFLLILSGVFQATAVINLSDKGFTPFLFSQIFFILRNFISIMDMNKKMVLPDKGYIYLLIFFIFSILGIILLPRIFEGIDVYPPDLGIDLNYIRGGNRLKFGGGNLAQGAYLLINLTCIYQLYKIRSKYLFIVGMKAFILSIFLVIFFGFWELSSKVFGILYYPPKFISNNAGYAIMELENEGGFAKINSTFIEPSYAGGYISAAFWSLFFINKLWAKIVSFVLFVLLCFNLSGTGFATFAIGGTVCLLLFKRNYLVIAGFSLILLYFFVDYIGFGDFIYNTVFNKSKTLSGIHRQGSNDFSIKVLLETSGLGVGLGSHRASSFIYTMIATSGFLTVFFSCYLFSLLKTINEESFFIRINSEMSNNYSIIFRFGLVYFIAQCLAIPDISNPTFWCWQYVAFLGVYITKNLDESISK